LSTATQKVALAHEISFSCPFWSTVTGSDQVEPVMIRALPCPPMAAQKVGEEQEMAASPFPPPFEPLLWLSVVQGPRLDEVSTSPLESTAKHVPPETQEMSFTEPLPPSVAVAEGSAAG
jgi:hypothetical protein